MEFGKNAITVIETSGKSVQVPAHNLSKIRES